MRSIYSDYSDLCLSAAAPRQAVSALAPGRAPAPGDAPVPRPPGLAHQAPGEARHGSWSLQSVLVSSITLRAILEQS